MGWGRKSHFYCEVESSRARTEKICSDAWKGFEITAAGWKGCIKVYIKHYGEQDHFEVRFEPWLKSESNNTHDGITLAMGVLDYDQFGVKVEDMHETLVRLDKDAIEALEFIKAKKIMTEGITNTTD